MFSKTCEYAIKIMVFIKTKQSSGRHIGLKQIAEEIDSPAAFTAKILQKLVHSDLLESIRGPHGGFKINSKFGKIYLRDIVESIDGDALLSQCVLGFEECSKDSPCAVHYKFVHIRSDLKETLSETTIDEIAGNVSSGSAFLKL